MFNNDYDILTVYEVMHYLGLVENTLYRIKKAANSEHSISEQYGRYLERNWIDISIKT